MTEISSVVKLSPRESVLENWEVVDDRGTPTFAEIIVALIALVGLYYLLGLVLHLMLGRFYWELRHDASFVLTVVWLLQLGIPILVVGWALLRRPPIKGHICLTNWRLLYFAQGQNWYRSVVTVSAANLEDVLGIHTFYTAGLFGQKMLEIVIHTRFQDGIKIEAGNVGSFLHKIPLLGRLLVRNTLGKDAFTMLPVLFTRVRQHTGAAVGSSLTY